MIARTLQEEIAEAIEEVVKGLYFEDDSGNKVSMKVYKQRLPMPETNDKTVPFPYTVVRIINGTAVTNAREASMVRILVLIGTKNTDKENTAYLDTMGVMHRIIERFSHKNTTEHFQLQGDIDWALDEENTYPYAFGGLDMTWKTQPVREENEFT